MHSVISEEVAKAKAKALRQVLAEKGVVLNHQACLDVVARVEYRGQRAAATGVSR